MRISISEHLITLRKLNNLTQQQVADYLSVSRSTYSRYETDDAEITFARLITLAELYQVSVCSFVKFALNNSKHTCPSQTPSASYPSHTSVRKH